MPHLTVTNPQTQCTHKIHYTVHGDSSSHHKILFVMGLLTDGQAWKYQTVC